MHKQLTYGIYAPDTLGGMLEWYPQTLFYAMQDLGLDVKLSSCPDDMWGRDMVFLMPFYKHVWGEAGDYQAIKPQCGVTALIQTEQLAMGLEPLNVAVGSFDVLVETYHENMPHIREHNLFSSENRLDAKECFDGREIVLFPLGYHYSMTHTDVCKMNYEWDVFMLELPKSNGGGNREKFHKALKDNNIKVFDGLPVYEPKQVAQYVKNAKICLYTHSHDGNALAYPRIIGNFMANGGFVLAQNADLCGPVFRNREHLVYFSDPEQMLFEIEYFLAHREERRVIADKALNHIKLNHDYRIAIEDMITKVANYIK